MPSSGMSYFLVDASAANDNAVVIPATKASGNSGSSLFRSNPTKRRILELLAEFFCLRTNDAAGLLRNRPIAESDARSVRRTLAILHRDGFLYRTPHLDFGHERGGITYIYGLSAKGVRHAFANGYATLATKTLDE